MDKIQDPCTLLSQETGFHDTCMQNKFTGLLHENSLVPKYPSSTQKQLMKLSLVILREISFLQYWHLFVYCFIFFKQLKNNLGTIFQASASYLKDKTRLLFPKMALRNYINLIKQRCHREMKVFVNIFHESIP